MKLTVTFDVPVRQENIDDYAEDWDFCCEESANMQCVLDELVEMIFDDDTEIDIVNVGTEEEKAQLRDQIQESIDKFSELNLKNEIRRLEAELEQAKARLNNRK